MFISSLLFLNKLLFEGKYTSFALVDLLMIAPAPMILFFETFTLLCTVELTPKKQFDSIVQCPEITT
jgi:hypothetical protein